MRPKRKIKSTKLSDFYYPVTGKKKKQESPKKLQKLSKKNPISPRRSISPIVATSPTRQVQRALSVQDRVGVTTSEPVNQEAALRSPSSTENEGEELNELYTNTALPSGYSGDLKKFILQKESISRHKRKLNIFKRRKVFVLGPWVAIQADTAFYISSASKNDGYKYI